MLTTETPLAYELSIASRAVSPSKLVPYPALVGTAITGQFTKFNSPRSVYRTSMGPLLLSFEPGTAASAAKGRTLTSARAQTLDDLFLGAALGNRFELH